MAKFKVGDKVRGTNRGGYPITDNQMKCATVKRVLCDNVFMTILITDHAEKYWVGREYDVKQEDFDLIEQTRREFIVIRRDGAKTIAELRHDREVIKSGTAICNASDTFDFQTGAKLAFDRLMGREEPKPEPKPAHRFKVGDRVLHEEYGLGTIIGYVNHVAGVPYKVRPDNVCCVTDNWAESRVSPAPAPEPPKFYTGKVVCISGEYGIGKVFTVRNGFFTDGHYNCPGKPYKSVDDMNDRFLFGKFAALKE